MRELSTPESRYLASAYKIQRNNELNDQTDCYLFFLEQRKAREKELMVQKFIAKGIPEDEARQRIGDIFDGKYKPKRKLSYQRRLFFARLERVIVGWIEKLIRYQDRIAEAKAR